jgi:NTP pyrophosphatase (non-canonical NTP hydrolase)
MQSIIDATLAFRDARDRKQFHNPKDIATAIAIEAAELQEHFLRKSQKDSYTLAQTPEAKEEFADIMIYMIQYADVAGIDIEKEVLAKLEKTKIKYPIEKAKGRNNKYTDL